MTRGADQHVVPIIRIDQDLGDVLAILQPDIGPVFAAIRGLVNSIAHRHAVAHPGFTAAHPYGLRIRWIDGHRTNRLHTLAIEDGLVCRSAVHRLPHAAARRSDENRDAAVLLDRVHRSDAPAHRRRADVARRQSRHGGGVELVTRLGVGPLGRKHETIQPKGTCSASSEEKNDCVSYSSVRVLVAVQDFASAVRYSVFRYPALCLLQRSSGESMNPDQPGLLFVSPQRSGNRKVRGIDIHIHFNLLDGRRLRGRIRLGPLRNRVRDTSRPPPACTSPSRSRSRAPSRE